MNDVLIDFGFFKIYWYSFLMVSAILTGIYLARREAVRIKFDKDFLFDTCFYMLIPAIIGARLYYVIFNFREFQDDILSIFKIWEGGIAVYGSIIGAVIFVWYYCKKKKVSFFRTVDIMVPSLILGQAIGRWGNFFNQEAYGRIVTEAVLVSKNIPRFIIDRMYIDGFYREPTFLYESLLCLLGFVIIMLIRYFYRSKKLGFLTGIYFIWYGIIRFFIEGHRDDSLYFFDFRISQIVSVILIITGLYLIFNRKIKERYYDRKGQL